MKPTEIKFVVGICPESLAAIAALLKGQELEAPPTKKTKVKVAPPEPVEDENETDTEEDTDDAEEAEVQTTAAKSDKKEKTKAPTKKFKKKAAAYSRTNEIHKKLFGEELALYDKTWRESKETKAAAKVVSEKMEGDDFMDDDGKIVSSFTTKLRKEYVALVTKKKK